MRSLRFRLLLTHLLVIAAGALVLIATSRSIAPVLFDDHLRSMVSMGSMGSMMGGNSGGTENIAALEGAFDDALNRGIAIAVAASSAVALLVSGFAAARIMRPIDTIRKASRRLADGAYGQRVALPHESELRALAEDFNSLAATLEQQEQRRMALIGDVAHELRTPISTIEGYLEGVLDGVFEPSEQVIGSMVHEMRRLRRLVSDLGALAQAQDGAGTVELAPIDAAEVVAATVERLRPQAEALGIELHPSIPQPLPVLADHDRLTQILTNILTNALAHTPAGGRITVGGHLSGNEIAISITDTGDGIPSHELENIFERFHRVGSTGRPGSGVGLTIARQLARAHGGDVTAQSSGPGQGSTFTIRIPARHPES